MSTEHFMVLLAFCSLIQLRGIYHKLDEVTDILYRIKEKINSSSVDEYYDGGI